MTDRIRIIPHAPEGIPDCGSFEVWFADGRPSEFFYWDDNRAVDQGAAGTAQFRAGGVIFGRKPAGDEPTG
jgi:hypothetical protein